MTTTSIPSTPRAEAPADGALTLLYQPKVELAIGAVSAVEACVPWNHPVHGFVAANAVTPVAGRTDGSLTCAVISQSLEDCRRWVRAGTPLQVAVNLPAQSVLDDLFPQTLSRLLQRARVPAPMLTLELAESAVLSDPDGMASMLIRIKELGVDLAVDGAGTRDTSLAYLERMPFDEVKIDRSLVSALGSGDPRGAIVTAIVAQGHARSKRVVADGVATALAYRALQALGCDEAQGAYVGGPVSAEAIPAFAHEWRPPLPASLPT